MPSKDPILNWADRNRELVRGCMREDRRQGAPLARVRAAFARIRAPLERPLTLYRGTRVMDLYNRPDGDGGSTYRPDSTAELPCPLSFTRSRAQARHFADWSPKGVGTGRGWIHVVALPAGTPVADVARYVEGVDARFGVRRKENARREVEVVLDRLKLRCTRVTRRTVYWRA